MLKQVALQEELRSGTRATAVRTELTEVLDSTCVQVQ